MTVTLSQRIFGLDWSAELPWDLDGLRVERGDFESDAKPFIAAHWDRLFDTKDLHQRFLADAATEAKRRFVAEADVFVLRASGTRVGLLLGHPLDWSTYYWRTVAVLEEHRNHGALAKVMEKSYAPLATAGVERVEGECSPTNSAMMRTLTKLGWVVTSTAMSERWGATVRFTKFLRDEAGEIFARQFCGVQARQRTAERRLSS